MENRHLSIIHGRSQISEVCLPPYSSDICSKLVPRHCCVWGRSWFQQSQVSLPAKMYAPATGGQAGKMGMVGDQRGCGRSINSISYVTENTTNGISDWWTHCTADIMWLWQKIICILLSTLLWNQFISSCYRVALMVPLSSLPLVFYPFISFSIPHALFYSTPVGKPVLLISPFSFLAFPKWKP